MASAQPDAGPDGGAVASGAGTAASPFQITSCEELQAIEYDLDAAYALAYDIECPAFDAGDGNGFRPIGDNPNPFTGSLDGAGHIVTGLMIDRPTEDWVGLFGVTLGALVTRIGLQGVSIEGRQRVGGIVGWQREGVIEESFVTGLVTGEQYVGGIAGRMQDGSILNSYAQVSLVCTKWDSKANKTNADCGGIIGGVVQGVTYNSYAAGAFAPQHGATGGGGPETLVASFFDCELTGGCDNTHPEGQPTLFLQDRFFYEPQGWDFNTVWGFSAQTLHPCLQWQATCSGGPGCGSDDPSCDGVDDDCDGAIDEDFPSAPTSCGVGACSATGVTSCDDGQVVDSCTPGTPASEDATCDAVDEDCDGTTDEDFVSVGTTCGVGACAGTGATSCVDGTEEDSCMPGSGASNDLTCNGGDDDCDGLIDEDYASQATSCGVGACAATGQTSCFDGTEEDSCVPGTPAAEDVTCNGIDDNCDGTPDSDFMPSSTTCGVGACGAT
ncbi:MAG: MopE-related protein, partial [Myxococcales bacterium]|nr:MopE-related protein [Myxococcales bacterium]